MADIYIGLMSGTSLDGVDGVLADFSGAAPQVLGHAYAPFSTELRQTFLSLNTSGADEIHTGAIAGNALARLYAQVVAEVLRASNVSATQVRAIGAHGQTVRHRPGMFDGVGYTTQINQPALLAELTGIDVVADFRSRDVAAGGQGAPLVPAFHHAVFGQHDAAVAVLNIGGIANVSLVGAQSASDADAVTGFDCGPGNALMDFWCQQHTNKPYDEDGRWAASGQVHADLLTEFLTEPYFNAPAPKSTGRDLFNPAWLQHKLARFHTLAAADVQATLAELTARTCSSSIFHAQKTSKWVIVCGGGALNAHLMARLQASCQAGMPEIRVASSTQFGLPPLQVEAAAFAWLARKILRRETGNLPKATGAQGTRILGAIYPA